MHTSKRNFAFVLPMHILVWFWRESFNFDFVFCLQFKGILIIVVQTSAGKKLYIYIPLSIYLYRCLCAYKDIYADSWIRACIHTVISTVQFVLCLHPYNQLKGSFPRAELELRIYSG